MSILRDNIDEFLTTLRENGTDVTVVVDSVNCVYGTNLPHPAEEPTDQQIPGQSPLFQPYVPHEKDRR